MRSSRKVHVVAIICFALVSLVASQTIQDDSSLVFELPEYVASVPEEVDGPLMVTQVAIRGLNDESSSGLRFFIRSPTDAPFVIDNFGVIWTSAKIDRESVSSFDLQVAAEDDRGNYGSCRVFVTIIDKNDNPPRFTRLFGANISESAPTGSFVIQLTSSDLDSDPAFSEATYSLLDANDELPFEIEPHSGRVILTQALDRETRDEYLLHVAVNDSSWRAQTTVTITVLDENDSIPKFEKDRYEFKRSASSKETRVGQVKATDADSGMNGAIEYLIETASDTWVINSQTGELSLSSSAVANLQHQEVLRFINVTIVAKDFGNPPLIGRTSVTLAIEPEDATSNVSPSSQVMIPLPVDLKNETNIYSLKSQMAIRSFKGSRVLQVIGNRVVYFGQGIVRPGDKYTFQLMSAMEEFNITIIITLPNLHEPRFEESKYQIIVPENSDKSQLLAHFVAIDEDLDPFNRDVKYSFEITNMTWNERSVDYYSHELSNSVSSVKNEQMVAKDLLSKSQESGIIEPFRMDPETGALYLKNNLDFELVVMYKLKITARDSAAFWSKNSSVTVFVHVSDINDNPPTFTNLKQLSSGLEIYENNLVGHIVGEVKAIDFDSLPNSQITYSLEPVLDHFNFSISHKTGQIQALDSFDFEKKHEYSLTIWAKNDETVKRSVTIKIRVKDILNESESLRSPQRMSFGIIIVVIFFVVLILVITASFFMYNSQNNVQENEYHNPGSRKMANSTLPMNLKQNLSQAGSLIHSVHGQYGHHSVHRLQNQNIVGNVLSPDIVDPQHPRMPPAPPSSSFVSPSDAYSEILVAAEHYDLENSNSSIIAPSDMDIAFRGHTMSQQCYKGFPSRVLPPGPLNGTLGNPMSRQDHRHVQLARLSPSVSELTAPRILTLHDLSPSTPSGPVLSSGHNLRSVVSSKLPTMCPRSPPTMSNDDDSSDDDANTIDSFTSSEYDESASCPKVKTHHQNIFPRV